MKTILTALTILILPSLLCSQNKPVNSSLKKFIYPSTAWEGNSRCFNSDVAKKILSKPHKFIRLKESNDSIDLNSFLLVKDTLHCHLYSFQIANNANYNAFTPVCFHISDLESFSIFDNKEFYQNIYAIYQSTLKKKKK